MSERQKWIGLLVGFTLAATSAYAVKVRKGGHSNVPTRTLDLTKATSRNDAIKKLEGLANRFGIVFSANYRGETLVVRPVNNK